MSFKTKNSDKTSAICKKNSKKYISNIQKIINLYDKKYALTRKNKKIGIFLEKISENMDKYTKMEKKYTFGNFWSEKYSVEPLKF